MGADVEALLWEGILGIGMGHGEGDREQEGKTIHNAFLRWSHPSLAKHCSRFLTLTGPVGCAPVQGSLADAEHTERFGQPRRSDVEKPIAIAVAHFKGGQRCVWQGTRGIE